MKRLNCPICSSLVSKGQPLGQSSPKGQTNGKKGLTGSSFLFSQGAGLSKDIDYVVCMTHHMMNDGRQIKHKENYDDAGTGTFLRVAFIVHRYQGDLNFVFDDHLDGFVAVRATRGE